MSVNFNNIRTLITPEDIVKKAKENINSETTHINISINNCDKLSYLDLYGILEDTNIRSVKLHIDSCVNFEGILSLQGSYKLKESFIKLKLKSYEEGDFFENSLEFKQYEKNLNHEFIFTAFNIANLPSMLEIDDDLFMHFNFDDFYIDNCKKLAYIPSFKNKNFKSLSLHNVGVIRLEGILEYYDDFIFSNKYSSINLDNLFNIETIEKTIFNCPDIEVNLTINKVKIPHINKITGKFTEFILNSCDIKEICPISSKNLMTLNLDNNLLKTITLIGSFEEIHINENLLSFVDLSKVISVNNIYMNSNYITDIIFNDIKDLAILSLSYNLITHLDLSAFSKISDEIILLYNPLVEVLYYPRVPTKTKISISTCYYYPIYFTNENISIHLIFNDYNIDDSPYMSKFLEYRSTFPENLSSKEIQTLVHKFNDDYLPANIRDHFRYLYSRIDFTDPGFSDEIIDYDDPSKIDNEFITNYKNRGIITLPSINKLKTYSLDDLTKLLSSKYLTTSELNRFYGPFIYSDPNKLYKLIYRKIHNTKPFFIKGNSFDNLDIRNYDDKDGDYSNIRIIYEGQKVLTLKEIKRLMYIDPSGELAITNPLYITIDNMDDEQQKLIYKTYNTPETFQRYFEDLNRGKFPTLTLNEIKKLREFLFNFLTPATNYYLNNNNTSFQIYNILNDYIKSIGINTLYKDYRLTYLNLPKNVQQEIELFLWEFFIYTIWSRQWKGWDYNFPLDYKVVCENQVRFANFRINKVILDGIYNKLSPQALKFINSLRAVYYQWGNNIKLDTNYPTLVSIIDHINKGNCIGVAGIPMLGTIYLTICFVLLTDNHSLQDDNLKVLQNLFNDAFKNYAPKLIELELQELEKQIQIFEDNDALVLKNYTKNFINQGYSKEKAEMEALQELLSFNKLDRSKHEIRIARYVDSKLFLENKEEVPIFYADVEHISNPEHPEMEIL